MADSKTCKCKIKPKSCYILAQLVNKKTKILSKENLELGLPSNPPQKKICGKQINAACF